MTTPEDPVPLVENFECRFDFQPGWVDLTLKEGTKAEARALATEIVDGLGPLALEIEKSAVHDDMVERAVDLNDDVPVLAAAYYAENPKALANLMVDSYGDEGVARPTREEVRPMLLEWGNAEHSGEPHVTYPELPAGPAVRVQSVLQMKRLFGFGRKTAGFIKYAVFPPEMQSLIVVTVTWEAIARTEEIARLADEAVQSLRITPLASGGTE